MMLGDKQRKFSLMVARLVRYMYDCGYEVTLGDAHAYKEDKRHIVNSKHYDKLAIDLNLFKDGEYLTETADHKEFGMYWENILGGRWGGNWDDGNHYEYKL